MKLNTRKFLMEDFKDQESWIAKLLTPLNQIIQELTTGINSNNISVSENLRQEIKEVKVYDDPSSYPFVFKQKFSQIPIGLSVIYCKTNSGITPITVPWIDWDYLGTDQLRINSISGLTPGLTYTIKIHVIYQ